MKSLQKRCMLVLVIIAIASIGYAQQYSIKERWNVKTGYGFYPNLGTITFFQGNISHVIPIEINYGLFKFMEIGLYSGYTNIYTVSYLKIDEDNIDGKTAKADVLFYGINANFHVLPFIVKKENFWLDLYLSGKFGGLYTFTEEWGHHSIPARGNRMDYGIYGGLAIYLGKHVGFFGEYGLLSNYSKGRAGISLKF
jgi:hypothetical protein